jgi:hypothetical protein
MLNFLLKIVYNGIILHRFEIVNGYSEKFPFCTKRSEEDCAESPLTHGKAPPAGGKTGRPPTGQIPRGCRPPDG